MSDISFSRYLWFVVNLNSVDVPCLIGIDFRGTNVLVLLSIEVVKRKPWETSQHTQTGHTAAVTARQLTSHLAGNRSLPKKTVTGFGHNLLPVLARNRLPAGTAATLVWQLASSMIAVGLSWYAYSQQS